MSECEREEREATLTVRFEGCREHGGFTKTTAQAHVAGVPPFAAIDGFLQTIEEVIAINIAQEDVIKRFVQQEAEWLWTEAGKVEPLPERAQEWLTRLLAHQLLLERVASRGYGARRDSASYSMPYEA